MQIGDVSIRNNTTQGNSENEKLNKKGITKTIFTQLEEKYLGY
jgi:hypothetical protein